MKRFFLCFILTILCLCAISAASAGGTLPQEVASYFNKDTVILDCAALNGHGSDDCLFVLSRSAGGVNTLYQFKQKNGQWKAQFSTATAVPQTSHGMEIIIAESGEEWPTDEHFSVPHLSVLQHDAGDEYPELCVTFELSGGKWLLHRVWSYTGYESMRIRSGAISYYKNIESSTIAGTVYGDIQRDIRYFSLSALPKTLKEARSKITSAPELPASAELTAQKIKFTGGQKFPVYSAPDTASLRGGNGKAVVSTNGWIQVFGRENGFILIQYSIDSGHYRFGYIEDKSLPKNADVAVLDFVPVSMVMTMSAAVTDDPLYSAAALTVLEAGTPVTRLAQMGSWAYIECASSPRLRGFVPVNSLSVPEHGFALCPAESGDDYDLFVMTKMFTGSDHRVYAVQGHFERVVEDEEYVSSETAPGSEAVYPLAPDFTALMLSDMTDDEMPMASVQDLYQWYIGAYLYQYDGHELVYACDLTDEQLETYDYDFWFVTTRIELNERGEITYMEYVYVPWA